MIVEARTCKDMPRSSSSFASDGPKASRLEQGAAALAGIQPGTAVADERFKTRASDAVLLKGPANSGKTRRLVEHTAQLMRESTENGRFESTIVFCATPTAVHDFQKRLAWSLDDEMDGPAESTAERPEDDPAHSTAPHGAGVRITTMRAFELELLGAPEAERTTGRRGRAYLPFEEQFLMEDMKRFDISPKKLREMLKFFFRSWTELEAMDEGFFYSTAERDVHARLTRCLTRYGAYLEPEIARCAYQYATGAASESGEAPHFDHVVVDDFQALSKASQCLACALADKSLWAADDEHACARVIDPYPYAAGADMFAQVNGNCRVQRLSPAHCNAAVARTQRALIRTIDHSEQLALGEILGEVRKATQSTKPFPSQSTSPEADGEGTIERVSERTPERCGKVPESRATVNEQMGGTVLLESSLPTDEVQRATGYVADLLAENPSERVAMVAPNAHRARAFAQSLSQAGVPVSFATPLCFGGDTRTVGGALEARMTTLLRLMANPRDALAVRCWCGFGDYLANGEAFDAAEDAGSPIRLDSRAINLGADESALTVKQAERVAAALRRAHEVIEAVGGLRGCALLDALAAQLTSEPQARAPRTLYLAAGSPGANETAADMCRALDAHATLGAFEESKVAVALPVETLGADFDTVVVCSAVNGAYPGRDYFDSTIVEIEKRPKLFARETQRLYASSAGAKRRIAVSWFTEAPLQSAEQNRLKIERVRLRHGERICEIHPSVCVQALLDQKPVDPDVPLY